MFWNVAGGALGLVVGVGGTLLGYWAARVWARWSAQERLGRETRWAERCAESVSEVGTAWNMTEAEVDEMVEKIVHDVVKLKDATAKEMADELERRGLGVVLLIDNGVCMAMHHRRTDPMAALSRSMDMVVVDRVSQRMGATTN